jgi:hypothetical protein
MRSFQSCTTENILKNVQNIYLVVRLQKMRDDASILSYSSLRRGLDKVRVFFRKITAIFLHDYWGLQLRKP